MSRLVARLSSCRPRLLCGGAAAALAVGIATGVPQAGAPLTGRAEFDRGSQLFEDAKYREAVQAFVRAREYDPDLKAPATRIVVRALLRSRPGGGTFHIEDVQDHVELGLMRGGHHEVARAYVLYRERRAQERSKQGRPPAASEPALMATDGGVRVPLDLQRLQKVIESACAGLGDDVNALLERLPRTATARDHVAFAPTPPEVSLHLAP